MIIFAIVFVALMAIMGTPVFIVISAFAIIGFLAEGIPLAAIVVDVYNHFANTPLLYTIPLFTFTGYLFAESNASVRIVDLSKTLLGWLPGSLAIVSLITCAFLTAFTGASGITIIALGGLLYPALIKELYPEKFSLGLLTSSGSLGLLFPPSLPLIFFAVISETSITQLFAAGLMPGFLLIIILSIYSIYIAKNKTTPTKSINTKTVFNAFWTAKYELIVPFAIMAGIISGFVTLGEIAVLCVVYTFFIETYIYKDIQINRIFLIIKECMIVVGGILIIMGSAIGFTNYMIDAQIPMVVLEFMQDFISSPFVFLIALNIFLLIIGCILDIYSAILVIVPLIVPIAESYGINIVHLGIIFLTNLEIGYSTPPVGMNLFISCLRFNKSVIFLYKASVPFIILLLIGLMIITYVPQLSLGLIEIFNIK